MRSGPAAGSRCRSGRRPEIAATSTIASARAERSRRTPHWPPLSPSPRRRIAAWPAANTARSGSARNMPGDQRIDDEKSVCFDGAPLNCRARHRRHTSRAADAFGRPAERHGRRAGFATSSPTAPRPASPMASSTYAIATATNSRSRSRPARPMEIIVKLDDIAYSVAPGHRLRLAISSTYWPLVWPSPEPVTLTLHQGSLRPAGPRIRRAATRYRFAEPEGAAAMARRNAAQEQQQPQRRTRRGERAGHARHRR